jgi:hypothetical protein
MSTAQALLKKFRDMKTLPHVAIRLTKLLSDEKSTMRNRETARAGSSTKESVD